MVDKMKIVAVPGSKTANALRFSYDKDLGQIESEFNKNRVGFYSNIVRTRQYNIKTLKSVLEKKGLMDPKK